MGNLLGAPVTEKVTESGSTVDGSVRFAVSQMQGWRVHMEDAHIAEARLYAICNTDNKDDKDSKTTKKRVELPGHALFAVFDGHGGSYAALYSGRNLCRVLSKQESFWEYAVAWEKFASKEEKDCNNNHAEERNLSKLLETALTNAFVELDREIACALKGTKVPDADAPYHDPHHQEKEEQSPKTNMAVNATNTKIQQQQQQQQQQQGNTTNHNNSNTNNVPSSPTDAALQLLEDEGDSGTTACVILLTPQFCICANAGDSRAILKQKMSLPSQPSQQHQQQLYRVVPLSFDHKPDDEAEERRIRAAGGYVAGGRVEGDLAVSRGLGDYRFKVLDIVLKGSSKLENNGFANANANAKTTTTQSSFSGAGPGPGPGGSPVMPGEQKVSPIPDVLVHRRMLQEDLFAVIACDGIWDVQTNEHCAKIVTDLFEEGESDLGLICEELCDTCLRLGSKDNMTTLVIQFPAQIAMSSSPAAAAAASLSPPANSASRDDNNNMNNNNNSDGGVLARRRAREADSSQGSMGMT